MEISNDVKKAILEQEIASCRANYYVFQVRAQAAKDVGGLEDAVEANLGNMELQQKLIGQYEKLLATLDEAEATE